MTAAKPMYIAGIGMITSVGGNAEMTAAAINAGISGYQASEYKSSTGKPLTMANVPDNVFFEFDLDLKRHNYFQLQDAHVIKMAVLAMQDAFINSCAKDKLTSPMPLLLAMLEPSVNRKDMPSKIYIENILNHSGIPIDPAKVHRFHSGRAAGIELLTLAQRYLYEQDEQFLLVGGADSHINVSQLIALEEEERLLFENQHNAFAPGEGASFILLTRNPAFANVKNGQLVTINGFGSAIEPGHLTSELPNKGEGLDLAFKIALDNSSKKSVSTIYSSLNGEAFWSKEQGVALIRNQHFMNDNVVIEHPADCIGDLGAATGTTLLALSALKLFTQQNETHHLVYSSSDGEKRAAAMLSSHKYQAFTTKGKV